MAGPDKTGRRALITGASAGIGAALAEALAARGDDLILVARRRDRLEEMQRSLGTRYRVSVDLLRADLTKAEDLDRVEAAIESDSSLGLVVNNAGFAGYRPFKDLDPGVADDLIGLHVRAVMRLSRAALPGMLKRQSGAIVNIASLLAFSGSLPTNPLPARATYAGAKAFIVVFTQLLATELAETGVRAMVVCPGIVATEFHTVAGMGGPLPGSMSAEDVALATLRGLDAGEVLCIPGLEETERISSANDAQGKLMLAGNKPLLAARYRR
ncbi:MAG TPA: SDR family NAD(P)-dependent oxidoreductase [Candidatus Dormibacteraeota bacterium]|jgi:short-subunit dehydrogenase